MPVTTEDLGSRLQVRLDLGTVNGRHVTRTRSYSNIKHDASDENLYIIGQGIAGVQEHTLEGIYRLNEQLLVEED